MAATDANLEVSNRQIELVARETEIAKLKGDLTRLREQRRESEEKLRQTGLDNKSGREALKAERARANELERRLEKALATVADREEALERRERELARLRENSDKPADTAETAPVPETAETGNIGEDAAGRTALSPENGEVPAATAVLPGRQEALARLAAERKRLEERLTTLTRENRRLRTASLSAPEPAPAAEPRPGEMALREQIGNLAAEMVALTALIEGPDSPIDKAIAAPERVLPGGPPSLAERVRALREAVARR
jgi:predicted  nucleic acid-binding Zn-ribbon protein